MRTVKREVGSVKFEKAANASSLPSPAPNRAGCEDPALHALNFQLPTSNFQLGFNLVETLVATMILSGAVLTLGAISTNALTDTRLNRHYETAAALADRQLTLIDYLGIDEFIQTGQTEGVFEEYEPGYEWQVSTEYQGTDDLYLVSIVIRWTEGRRPYSITVQTMLNGTLSTAETTVGTKTGTETTSGEQTGESNPP